MSKPRPNAILRGVQGRDDVDMRNGASTFALAIAFYCLTVLVLALLLAIGGWK